MARPTIGLQDAQPALWQWPLAVTCAGKLVRIFIFELVQPNQADVMPNVSAAFFGRLRNQLIYHELPKTDLDQGNDV